MWGALIINVRNDHNQKLLSSFYIKKKIKEESPRIIYLHVYEFLSLALYAWTFRLQEKRTFRIRRI